MQEGRECPYCDGEGSTPPTQQYPLGDICYECSGLGWILEDDPETSHGDGRR